MSGVNDFLIPSNFSIISSNQLKKYMSHVRISSINNSDKYIIRYIIKGDSIQHEFIFDAKVEMRNQIINDICSN